MSCFLGFSRITLVMIVIFGFSSGFARADENTRVTNPTSIGVEVLGRGLLYSVDFDQVVTEDLAAGVGFGTSGTKTLSGADTGVTATLIPVYANYYFAREHGSLFATGGFTVVTNSGSVSGLKSSAGNLEFTSSVMFPSFGLGYEARSDAGFLFRGTGYGLVGAKLVPWLGVSFGYAF